MNKNREACFFMREQGRAKLQRGKGGKCQSSQMGKEGGLHQGGAQSNQVSFIPHPFFNPLPFHLV
jgi:hypothetical protein